MRCSRADKTSVAPRRVRVTQSLTVEPDAVPAGETVARVDAVSARAAGSAGKHPLRRAASPRSTRSRPNRRCSARSTSSSAAQAGKPTTFSDHLRADDLRPVPPDRSREGDAASSRRAELAPYLGERPPHIVFTDDLRKFSREVVGDERNPYRIAQKLFARRRSHSVGRCARILDDLATSATTRCTPATPTAASRRCC